MNKPISATDRQRNSLILMVVHLTAAVIIGWIANRALVDGWTHSNFDLVNWAMVGAWGCGAFAALFVAELLRWFR